MTGRDAPSDVVGVLSLRALIEAGPPLVICDDTGRVSLLTSAAQTLFPSLRTGQELSGPHVPAWLAAAHSQGLSSAEGTLAERHLMATRLRLPEGDTAWQVTDVTNERNAVRRLAAERERTRFLAHASSRLLASLNERKCLHATAELAAGQLADAAIVVTSTDRRRMTITSCVRDQPVEERTVSADADEVPGLAEALAGFPPVPSRWVDPALAPQWLLPAGFHPLGSLIVTPLPGNGVPAGALVLLRREKSRIFTEDDEAFARLFAARAGAAISAAALYADKSETTALLQQSLLPPVISVIEGIDLAGAYRPARAAHRIGGDFYDVHPALPAERRLPGAGDETFLVLGDVCGKGTGAAILTGKIRNTLSALRHVEARHDRLLRLLNDTLLDDAGDARFATLVLAGATPLGQGRLGLRLTSAGHPPPLIVRREGHVEETATHGTLIGALPQVTATTVHTVLEPGEVCLLYSDGVTEARGGPRADEMFGEPRLRDALTGCAGMPVEAVVERVEMLTAEWLGSNEHDDIALLAVGPSRGGGRLTLAGGTGPGRGTR